MFSVEVYHQNPWIITMTLKLDNTIRPMKVLGIGLLLDVFKKVTLMEFLQCETERVNTTAACARPGFLPSSLTEIFPQVWTRECLGGV